MRCTRCGREAAEVMYERLGDWEAAEQEFRRSVEEVSSLYPLAQIHARRGDDGTPSALLERARPFGKATATT